VRFAGHALALVGVVALTHASNARASWPPPQGADLTDAANWPDDPAYPTLWN